VREFFLEMLISARDRATYFEEQAKSANKMAEGARKEFGSAMLKLEETYATSIVSQVDALIKQEMLPPDTTFQTIILVRDPPEGMPARLVVALHSGTAQPPADTPGTALAAGPTRLILGFPVMWWAGTSNGKYHYGWQANTDK